MGKLRFQNQFFSSISGQMLSLNVDFLKYLKYLNFSKLSEWRPVPLTHLQNNLVKLTTLLWSDLVKAEGIPAADMCKQVTDILNPFCTIYKKWDTELVRLLA